MRALAHAEKSQRVVWFAGDAIRILSSRPYVLQTQIQQSQNRSTICALASRISWLVQAAMTNKAPTSLSIISHKVCQTTAWHAAPLVQCNSLCCNRNPLHTYFCIECRRLTLLRVYTPGQHGSITNQAACLRGVGTDMRSGKLQNVGVCSEFAVILKLCRVCKGLTHAQEEEMSSVNETAMAYPTILYQPDSTWDVPDKTLLTLETHVRQVGCSKSCAHTYIY